MNQPDLGLKVAELRTQKGLTQEQLAENCEVSVHSIQRIESGEVEPRAFTRNSLSTILEFDIGRDTTENESRWLAVLHLSSVLCLVLIPLLLWTWKKNQSYKIDKQGREVLNFQITVTLILFAGALVLMIIPIFLLVFKLPLDGSGILWNLTPLPILLVWMFATYQGIANTVRALSNGTIHYPLSIPFVR
jgi:uncharacterized Tic20 family protein